MDAVRALFRRTILAFLATVGVLVGFGLLMGTAESFATQKLYALFGWESIVVTGLVGTPVHELGHFLGCKLFGMQVSEVSLFRPVEGRADGILGFVRFSYDPSSLWQRLGCFFTGIAPMLFGVLVILLLTRILAPEIFFSVRKAVATRQKKTNSPVALTFSAIGGAFGGFGSLFKKNLFAVLRGLLCLYLTCSVSVHMSLSLADMKGAAVGLLVVLAMCVIYAAISLLAGWKVEKQLSRLAASLSLFFGIGLLLCLLTLGAALLIDLIRTRVSMSNSP